MRILDAHKAPSLIFQGIGISELLAALMFMLTAKPETRRTAIFWLSAVAWVFITAALAIDVAILDYFTSPYDLADRHWHPKMVMSGFFTGFVGDLCLLALFIVRLRIFYRNSFVLWLLAVLGTSAILIVLPADYIAIAANIEVINDRLDYFTNSPHIGLVNLLFTISHSTQCLFSALSSMAFLWAIGKGLGFSKKGFLYEVMFNHDGIRFIVIIGLNITVALFNLLAYFNGYDYINYCMWYLPTLVSSIELRTFLITSYVAPRDIIERNRLGITATSPIPASRMPSYNSNNSYNNQPVYSSEEAKRSRYDMELDQQRKDTVRYF
ncbi:hypothetical protein HK105_204355 [Polyrhizophydium stewartii]|uniref:Uncharacterized protein n=1 Tax=Polyrhizophydium stewartii TaxID=2732419 RepID=A0ABR4N9Z1_9FUNG|nr:hypothetical protein HK105_001676 [Polyrhizophydium stewartii]